PPWPRPALGEARRSSAAARADSRAARRASQPCFAPALRRGREYPSRVRAPGSPAWCPPSGLPSSLLLIAVLSLVDHIAFLRERDRFRVPPAPASRLVSGDQDDRLAGGVEHEEQAYLAGTAHPRAG